MKEPPIARNPSSTQPEVDPVIQAYGLDLQGFLAVPNALKAAQVGWIRTWEDLNCRPGPSGWLNMIEFLDSRDTEHRLYCNLIEGGEVFEALMDHPLWFDALQPEAGDGSITLVQSEMIVSPQPSSYVTSTVALVLVALDDVPEQHQSIRVVPGSHRTKLSHPSHSMPGKWDSLFTQDICLSAGDALVIKPGLCYSFRTSLVERVRFLRLGYALTHYTGDFYCPSSELLERLTPVRKSLISRFVPRAPQPRERVR